MNEKIRIVSRDGSEWSEPAVMEGGTSENLRGDRISGDRYWSREFMDLEWDNLWTRVWHIGARVIELEEPGDFVVHNIGHESVLIVRQESGSIRAFYNVCPHRGNRLVWGDAGGLNSFTCAYHGWQFGVDGELKFAPDPENFRGGSPCGRVSLVEVECDTWAGFVQHGPGCQAIARLPGSFAKPF